MNRQGKIIILTLIIIIKCVCLYTISYADTESTQEKTTYNVNISWGDLTYLYESENAYVGSEQPKYVDNGTGVWIENIPGSSGNINVKNSSNVDIKVGATFDVQNSIEYGNIIGNFYIKKDSYYIEKGRTLEERIEKGTLEKPTERTIVLKLKGKPNVHGKTEDTLGTVTITIDTVYGFMRKYGYCPLTPINNKQVLESYLKRTFSGLERAILQEFEEMENSNRVEVIDDKAD